MQTTCPRCASIVTEAESTCRQCGWNAPYFVRPRRTSQPAVSYTERYRGTVYDSQVTLDVVVGGRIARGRTFVAVGLMAVTSLIALIFVARPPV